MKTESICPICKKPKIKISPSNIEFKKVMCELGIDNINDLNDISKGILNMNRYVFACGCYNKPFKITQVRKKDDIEDDYKE